MFGEDSILSRGWSSVWDPTIGRVVAFWAFMCPVQRRFLLGAWVALASLLATSWVDHWLADLVLSLLFCGGFIWSMALAGRTAG